jgi:hypothetical protein
MYRFSRPLGHPDEALLLGNQVVVLTHAQNLVPWHR